MHRNLKRLACLLTVICVLCCLIGIAVIWAISADRPCTAQSAADVSVAAQRTETAHHCQWLLAATALLSPVAFGLLYVLGTAAEADQ